MPLPDESPHVLVLNNSEQLLALFRNILEGEGYVVSAESYRGQDLVHIVTLAPDLIILDYMWSTDDDRWTLLQLLRLDPRTRLIPIILCTAAVTEVEALRAHLDTMHVQVVIKPFELENILQVVAMSLQPGLGNGVVHAFT